VSEAITPARMSALDRFAEVVGPGDVLTGAAVSPDFGHDESLVATPTAPAAVLFPADTSEVSAILRVADELGVPVVARGSGTGLSGGAVPTPEAVVVSFARMNRILEIDTENHVAVVQPGVTLEELDARLTPLGLVYPVFPGENSASIGGNVATNAGGMRAIKYGVTRHQVLGLEVVLAGGQVIRTGGRFVKSSTGYDLTQLVVGSEGTLGLVTEVTLKLYPRPAHSATVLAPFASLAEITKAVPRVIEAGIGPRILEYVDAVTLSAITGAVGLDVGVPEEVRQRASAYLIVVLESAKEDRVEEDVEELGTLIEGLGALDVYVLPPSAAPQLIVARERAFYVAKAAGANDLIDVVVPRASMPGYLADVAEVAEKYGSYVGGCGHVGDGNVHLSVFQRDPERLAQTVHSILELGISHGGAISGEHGIGTDKRAYLAEFEDPGKLALMRRIKAAFDPHGILGPGRIFEDF
jgi:glycolate oxidase